MPADDLRFLTRTAVLGRMSGPLCDEVLAVSGSAAILELYARSNLFVVPLDANREWYRYHHLFQEVLRSDLARAEPDLERSLLARASEWCEANGQLETAIGYAQQACDVDRVAQLVERCALSAYLQRPRRYLGALAPLAGASRGARAERPGCSDRWGDRDGPGPARTGGAFRERGRKRLRPHPPRRQPDDPRVAVHPACPALCQGSGDNARGCRACAPGTRSWEALPLSCRCCC